MPEKARAIVDSLKFDFNCQYDEKDSIGKRYRRQDAIGTPFCITVDHQTLEDNTVTVRYRDTMEQERVSIDELRDMIGKQINFRDCLRNFRIKIFSLLLRSGSNRSRTFFVIKTTMTLIDRNIVLPLSGRDILGSDMRK